MSTYCLHHLKEALESPLGVSDDIGIIRADIHSIVPRVVLQHHPGPIAELRESMIKVRSAIERGKDFLQRLGNWNAFDDLEVLEVGRENVGVNSRQGGITAASNGKPIEVSEVFIGEVDLDTKR
jgi:hypothetical protein